MLVEGDRVAPSFAGIERALAVPDTQLRLFGKPEVVGRRRMAVTLALGLDVDEARATAREAAAQISVVER